MGAEFSWQRWPRVEALLEGYLQTFLGVHLEARMLDAALAARASVRLFDLLDDIVVRGDGAALHGLFQENGFVREEGATSDGLRVYGHPGAQVPRLVLHEGPAGAEASVEAITVKVELIEDFLMVRGLNVPIEGSPFSPLRTATLWPQDGRSVRLVERRGDRGTRARAMPHDYAEGYVNARARWATRTRVTSLAKNTALMTSTRELAREIVADMGRDTAAWAVFEVERAYWERRNFAAQVQKARQDRLGIGWANHDHHTFRSSRAAFATLIGTLEDLGFVCRERFYAGAEAGWGAQVLEQAACGLVVFADVDLLPEETQIDFAHTPLAETHDHLGTVGLWCALHGESILDAGMHHLEGQFEFERLRDDLAASGVAMMKPFSDFPHLRQAFTKGERWPVSPARLDALRTRGIITDAQYETFSRDGAIGSHLENLQRHDGYKGFNQHNVSTIIRATDPRAALETAPA